MSTQLTNGGISTFMGDPAKGVYLWGAQLEAAPFASSYIPTTTAAVTRNEDVLSYPIDNVSNAAGACYAEVGLQSPMVVVYDRIIASTNSGASPLFAQSTNPAAQIGAYDGTNAPPAPVTSGVPIKAASTWGVGRLAVANNGLATTVAAYSGTVFNITTNLRIGADSPYDTVGSTRTIRNVQLWNGALSNAQLVELTE